MNTDSSESLTKLAFSIDETCAIAGVGRTFLYGEIGAGRLIARKARGTASKVRGRTLILRADLENWLSALPPMKSAPAEPEAA